VLNSTFCRRNVVTFMFRVIVTVHSFPSQYTVNRLVFLMESTVFSTRSELKFCIYCRLIFVWKAVLRQWLVRHWPRRTGYDPRPVNLRLMLDDVALLLPFSPISTIPSMPRIHLQPSAAVIRRTRSRGPLTYKRPVFFMLLGKSWTATYFHVVAWSSKVRETRFFVVVFLNEVGVRLSSLLSDTSRPEGAGRGGWGGGVQPNSWKSFPLIVVAFSFWTHLCS
jgi:hypothetical protein